MPERKGEFDFEYVYCLPKLASFFFDFNQYALWLVGYLGNLLKLKTLM